MGTILVAMNASEIQALTRPIFMTTLLIGAIALFLAFIVALITIYTPLYSQSCGNYLNFSKIKQILLGK